MNSLTLVEHDRLPLSAIPADVLRELERLDTTRASNRRDTVFDWSRRGFLQARNWVGVIQVHGTSIEILPKIAAHTESMRANLARMLAVCRQVPVRDLDFARTDFARQSLHELFLRAFARRLLDELRRGPDANYVLQREHMTFVRGRIEMSEHLRRNHTRRDRNFVAFDDHVTDTPLNKVLRAGCDAMSVRSSSAMSRRLLREAQSILADVTVSQPTRADFDAVTFDRRNDRFRELFQFCRNYLEGLSPTPVAGNSRTTALLFPMEEVFEEYVARMVRRHADLLGYDAAAVHPQARGWHRSLLREPNGVERLHLRPDLIIGVHGQTPAVVLDTKWKSLDATASSIQGVSASDAYQLYAYAHRYGAPENMLVYPLTPGVQPRRYELLGTNGQALSVRFFNLGGDLRRQERQRVAALLAT